MNLYLLTDVDVPFVQDGWRDGETVRAGMQERFLEEVRGAGVPYFVVRGDWEARRSGAASCGRKSRRRAGISGVIHASRTGSKRQ